MSRYSSCSTVSYNRDRYLEDMVSDTVENDDSAELIDLASSTSSGKDSSEKEESVPRSPLRLRKRKIDTDLEDQEIICLDDISTVPRSEDDEGDKVSEQKKLGSPSNPDNRVCASCGVGVSQVSSDRSCSCQKPAQIIVSDYLTGSTVEYNRDCYLEDQADIEKNDESPELIDIVSWTSFGNESSKKEEEMRSTSCKRRKIEKDCEGAGFLHLADIKNVSRPKNAPENKALEQTRLGSPSNPDDRVCVYCRELFSPVCIDRDSRKCSCQKRCGNPCPSRQPCKVCRMKLFCGTRP